MLLVFSYQWQSSVLYIHTNAQGRLLYLQNGFWVCVILSSRGNRPPQSYVGGIEEQRQRKRLQVLAFDRTFLLFSSLPLITLPLQGCTIKKLQVFNQGVFPTFCPFATEIPMEDDSMFHVQRARAASIQQKYKQTGNQGKFSHVPSLSLCKLPVAIKNILVC